MNKKDNFLIKKFVELLEETGAKVVDVTPKTVEEKRLEKINKIFEEIEKDHFNLNTKKSPS